jgi:uncharacterized membrane protein
MEIKKLNIKLGAVLVLAFLIRAYHITSTSLWHDEAFSALLIKYPWPEMLYRIGLDVHPPGYYVFLRLWSYFFGESLLSLRGFSVFFGVATVLVAYLFIKAAFGKEKIALVGALLVAVHPFQAYYLEARMYTFGTFLIIASAWMLVRAFATGYWRYWAAFAGAAALAAYTHYYLLFSVAALGLFALAYAYQSYGWNWRNYKKLVGACGLAALAYLPWLPVLIRQFSQVQSDFWIADMNRWSVLATNYRFIFGAADDTGSRFVQAGMIAAALVSLGVIYKLARTRYVYRWLVILGIVAPFVAAVILSWRQSIYLDRYFLFAALFYTIALAVFIVELPRKRLRYGLLCAVVVINLVNWHMYWSKLHLTDKPGMEPVAEYLTANVGKTDRLLVGHPFVYFSFQYYNQTGQNPKLYSPKPLDKTAHYWGTALLSEDRMLYDLGALPVSSGTTIWMLWIDAFGRSKPVAPPYWHQVDEKSWRDIHPYPDSQIVVTKYQIK